MIQSPTERPFAVALGLCMDDRGSIDRRQRPTPMLSRHAILGGRRRAGRRTGETEGSFVDQHGTLLFLAATSVVLLNVLDAFFTILFLSHGGREMNPLVDAILQMGLGYFLLLKSVGIGFCVLVLTIAKNFRAARIGLYIVLSGYLLLLGWHLYLLQYLP